MPASLLEKLAMGDEGAFGRIYELYREPFTKWVLRKYGVDEDESIDVFQDAVVCLYENAVRGRLKSEAGLKSYLFVIGRNILVNRLKKNGRTVTFGDLSALPLAGNEIILPENEQPSSQTRQVAALLEQMGEPCKSILEFYYFYEWSMEDIAQRLQYSSPDVAKTQKSRCVKRFRQMMDMLPDNMKREA